MLIKFFSTITLIEFHEIKSCDSRLLQVSNLWPTKFGLLLERKNSAPDASQSPPRYTAETCYAHTLLFLIYFGSC